MAAQAVGAQADPVARRDPVGELGRRPGARARRHLGPHTLQHRRGQGRRFAPAWFVRQGVKPAGEEGFDPGAHGLLVLAEVARDARHAPARVREAHHLQTIAGTRRESRAAGAGA